MAPPPHSASTETVPLLPHVVDDARNSRCVDVDVPSPSTADTTTTTASNISIPLTAAAGDYTSREHGSDSATSPPPSSATLNNATAPQNATLGYTLMAASSLCHALMTFLVHIAEVNHHLPSATAVVIRAFTSLTLSSLYLLFSPSARCSLRMLTPRTASLLSLRGLFGGLSAWLSFAALARLPVGTAVTLFYMSPALTSIASAVILRDHPLTLSLGLTIAVNFAGVALVSGNGANVLSGARLLQQMAGVGYALGMACCGTMVFVLQRAMGLRVHFVLGVFAYGMGCALVAGVLVSWDDVRAVVLGNNRVGAAFALGSAVMGFGSQSFLNRGLQHAPAGPAIVVRSMSVPVTFALGLVFLGETVTWMAVTGVVMVLGSVGMIGLQKVTRPGHTR